jgi:hypothetical protein
MTMDYSVTRVAAEPIVRSHWGPVKEARAEEILDAIRHWAEQYGEPPLLADWEPSRARRSGQDWRADRWEAGDWPSTRMVRNHFGTMSAAIRAAGFSARRTPSRRRPHISAPEAVLSAIRAWNDRYGSPPTMTDWDPARARRVGQEWRIARYYENDWPSLATVRYHYKTLNLAVTAAGLEPRRPGAQPPSAAVAPRRQSPQSPAQHMLALRVRSVATAARHEDSAGLVAALNDLAATALNWADDVRLATT